MHPSSLALPSDHLEALAAGRVAGERLACSSTEQRRAWLEALATALDAAHAPLLAANAEDLAAARAAGLDAAKLDRMALDSARLAALAQAVREVAAQPDPLAYREERGSRPSGIRVARVAAPLGLIAMIYEARPNVTVDAAALALYAGNAILLRPGKEIARTALALGAVLEASLGSVGLPSAAVQVVTDPDRAWFRTMCEAAGLVDLLIPRGGEGLIRAVQAAAKVPVLAHAEGVCHTYLHASADPAQALAIVLNGKVQRPGVCNATEGLVIDRAALPALWPPIAEALQGAGVRIHASPELVAMVPGCLDDGLDHRGREWLRLELTAWAVEGLDEAIDELRRYGSGHTEAIVATDEAAARRFQREVQASCVMWNASTRFNDGGELGLGAEIGISTTRLHAWGPMGAEALTTRRWLVEGEGAVRA
jgi:glutamate-5-semialdehyde dehydrogenase